MSEPENEQNADELMEQQFSEDAIEEAYLQALKASEEAGLFSDVAYTDSSYEDELAAAGYEVSPRDIPAEAATTDAESVTEAARHSQFTPQQIIESLLFVGGEKLSARKIASLLGQHCEEVRVREWVDEINTRYLTQNRPYEIVLGEDGYQMSLRFEFQQQRHLLFGLGPREVKLSQEALEVLAFIAYRQPATQEQILEIDRPQVLSTLRQLVRRELVAVERSEEDNIPRYRTTNRFLKVFGLTQLADLPRSRDLMFK